MHADSPPGHSFCRRHDSLHYRNGETEAWKWGGPSQGEAGWSGDIKACVLSEICVNRLRNQGSNSALGGPGWTCQGLAPFLDCGHCRMGRNEASRQSMGRGLAKLGARLTLGACWGLVSKLCPGLVSQIFLSRHKAVPLLTSQYGFEESLNKKVDWDELPKELPA